MLQHLTQRVAWHDSAWKPQICCNPGDNPFCVALPRVRESRKDEQENEIAGKPWSELSAKQMPPCVMESTGFMNEKDWIRWVEHPYVNIKKAAETHGHLKTTPVKVAPYTTFAVPYWWMRRENQKEIDEKTPDRLAKNDKAPFKTGWVFNRDRQQQLLDLFFDRLTDEKSLVFFYCKQGHPLGEDDAISRLIVGVGRIVKVHKIGWYASTENRPYPLWDRQFHHSIRPDGHDGFLLPYHQYLEDTGDPEENERRTGLLREIAAAADPAHHRQFSYVSELTGSGVALRTLSSCLNAVRVIREHGIASGPWEKREEWLNTQIAATWKDRGAFPGLGSALEAMGMRLGTSLVLDLMTKDHLAADDNPWPLVDAIIRGDKPLPDAAYQADVDAVRNTWLELGASGSRKSLIELLSRFDLTPTQAQRWFNPHDRHRGTTGELSDDQLLANPYRICESDLGDRDDRPVAITVLDQGLLPDATIASNHPVPEPSRVASAIDARRLTAALVTVLRQAADGGDSLISVDEAIERVRKLALDRPCELTHDWLKANKDHMAGTVEQLQIPIPGDGVRSIGALQLSELKQREDRLRKILQARAAKELPSLGAPWRDLIIKSVQREGGKVDESLDRHVRALNEQAEALERITTRKLSVLLGRAGSGKTSVLGALAQCDALKKSGLLFLAPTGKARVRLSRATDEPAMTVAQFLYQCERYDGGRQRPLFEGGSKHQQERCVVVDECSMLTMDDLTAILEALDQAHVQRIILVGDPNQLPPIGVGRPFADLAGSLELAADSEDSKVRQRSEALARLTVELRTYEGGPSDALRLAGLCTRETQTVDADRIFSELSEGKRFNDLGVHYWQSHDELQQLLLNQLANDLDDMSAPDDIEGFNRALGFTTEEGFMPFDDHDRSESFQILSPVRMHGHGVHELNRWVQRTFRKEELKMSHEPWRTSLGDENIVARDKVIQVRNEKRKGYDFAQKETVEDYLANGEIGVIANDKNQFLNVGFAGRPHVRFGYRGWDFPGGAGPLQLAYALTVHKSQGSQFEHVYVVLPKVCRLLTRELLYTALTRARKKLVLLIEGDDASVLFNLSKPDASSTALRNTNLFTGCVRERFDTVPYAEHLIHRTEAGHMVRSKSELLIANKLHQLGITYEYERLYTGDTIPGQARPDFAFTDPSGELILWEHLGMLHLDDYRESWERKQKWYHDNGFVDGETLFTTVDDERGGLDSTSIQAVAETIQDLI